MSKTVDAVLIKRYVSQACEECDVSLYGVKETVGLGAVLKVDPASRRTVAVATRHRVQRFELEVVNVVNGEDLGWIPTELINWPGK